jgi:hypothetical protein
MPAIERIPMGDAERDLMRDVIDAAIARCAHMYALVTRCPEHLARVGTGRRCADGACVCRRAAIDLMGRHLVDEDNVPAH